MLFEEDLLPLLDLCGALCEGRGTLQLSLTDLLNVNLVGTKDMSGLIQNSNCLDTPHLVPVQAVMLVTATGLRLR